MIIISSVELRNNMRKYLDRARTEKVVVRRGKSETFVLTRQDEECLPADFHKGISGTELKRRLFKHIDAIFEK